MRGSVKNEIDMNGYLSEMQAMHYFMQAAEGLVYLHSRKPKAIIHRDIKSKQLTSLCGLFEILKVNTTRDHFYKKIQTLETKC